LKKINYISFPAVNNANDDGLLAMGGDLSLDTLVSAYRQGIFPWFNEGQPVLWWSPDPRLVLFPDNIKISRSLRKKIKQRRFTVTCDQAFERVIQNCAVRERDRPHSADAETWITESMNQAYTELHRNGYAHSIEVWDQQTLVGGLYGVVLGKVFFGESMFSLVTDASKVALVHLCWWLQQHQFTIIDCQVSTDHLISMGAEQMSRRRFIEFLDNIDVEQNSMTFSEDFEQLAQEPAI